MRARHHDKFSFSSSFEQNIQIENSTLWNYYNALEIGKVFWVELAITSVLALSAVSPQ